MAAGKVGYRIRVHTGESDESADAIVTVRITGAKGTLEFDLDKKHAVNAGGALFLCQSEDVFELSSQISVGDVDLVEVDHCVTPLLDRSWHLLSITIEDLSTETAYSFPCNDWFSYSRDDCRQSRVYLDRKIISKSELHRLKKGERFEDIPLTGKNVRLSEIVKLPIKELTPEEAKRLIQTLGVRMQFSNWGENVKATVLAFFPWNLSLVQSLFYWVKIAQMKVRVCGATHSWTNLYPDPGQVLIRTDHFELRPRRERIRLSGNLVTIKCNVTTYECKRHQLENDYCFPFNTVLGGVTYGGIIGTGCHGTGRGCKAHPDLVEEITIVNTDETLKKYSRSENEDLLNAVTTSMGLFGFIYEITFKITPKQRIVVMVNDNKTHTVEDTLVVPSALKKLVEDTPNISTEIFWFPYNSNPRAASNSGKRDSSPDANTFAQLLLSSTPDFKEVSKSEWIAEKDKLVVKTVREKTESEADEPVEDASYYIKKYSIGLLQSILFRNIPSRLSENLCRTPWFTTLAHYTMSSFTIGGFELGTKEKIVQELPRAIHYQPWVTQGFRVYDLEYAFKIDSDYQNIADACQAVVDVVKKYHKMGEYPMSMCFEMRFMSDSQSYLCPAGVGNSHESDKDLKVAYIEVLGLAANRDTWENFALEVAAKWEGCSGVKPLPHWGKMSELGSSDKTVEYLWKNNKDNMEKFVRLLKESKADRRGIFFNEYLTKIFRKDN